MFLKRKYILLFIILVEPSPHSVCASIIIITSLDLQILGVLEAYLVDLVSKIEPLKAGVTVIN